MPDTTQVSVAEVAVATLEDVTGGCRHCCRPPFAPSAPSFSSYTSVQINAGAAPAPAPAPQVGRVVSTSVSW